MKKQLALLGAAVVVTLAACENKGAAGDDHMATDTVVTQTVTQDTAVVTRDTNISVDTNTGVGSGVVAKDTMTTGRAAPAPAPR